VLKGGTYLKTKKIIGEGKLLHYYRVCVNMPVETVYLPDHRKPFEDRTGYWITLKELLF
jgi:hypothetical protein